MLTANTLIVALAALSLACDDPAAEARAINVLAHGAAHAAVSCSGTFNHPDDAARPYEYKAVSFQDGSTLVIANTKGRQSVAFCERSEDCSDHRVDVATNYPEYLRFTAEAGYLTIIDPVISGPSDTPDTVDLSASCTGFELEIFGVE